MHMHTIRNIPEQKSCFQKFNWVIGIINALQEYSLEQVNGNQLQYIVQEKLNDENEKKGAKEWKICLNSLDRNNDAFELSSVCGCGSVTWEYKAPLKFHTCSFVLLYN